LLSPINDNRVTAYSSAWEIDPNAIDGEEWMEKLKLAKQEAIAALNEYDRESNFESYKNAFAE